MPGGHRVSGLPAEVRAMNTRPILGSGLALVAVALLVTRLPAQPKPEKDTSVEMARLKAKPDPGHVLNATLIYARGAQGWKLVAVQLSPQK